jgi:hypothetical protein
VDIYTFLGERDQLNQDVTKFDSETVHQYHLRFGERIVKLADEAVAVGVPRDDLALWGCPALTDRADDLIRLPF